MSAPHEGQIMPSLFIIGILTVFYAAKLDWLAKTPLNVVPSHVLVSPKVELTVSIL